jgi:hypothetical protein
MFCHLAIRKNRLVLAGAPSTHPRLRAWFAFFGRCCEAARFPDVDVVVCLHDLYGDDAVLRAMRAPALVFARRAGDATALLFPDITMMGHQEAAIRSLSGARRPWPERKAILFWRGATTGHEFDRSPRKALVEFSRGHPGLADAAFCSIIQVDEPAARAIARAYPPKARVEPRRQAAYRYLAAVDGNSYPTSLYWQLYSGSLTVRQASRYDQWYHAGLSPFVHYVPYEPSCSDLAEKLSWIRAHDDEARGMADNALDFWQSSLTNEDIVRYAHALLTAYADLQRF